MKKYIVTILTLIFVITSGFCEGNGRKLSFGVQTGTDLGGTIPRNMSSSMNSSSINAHFFVRPNIGIWGGYAFSDKWSAQMELSYKSIAMRATVLSIREPQIIDFEESKSAFLGLLQTNMSFRMWEIPLLVKYNFNPRSSMHLGAYYSFVNGRQFRVSVLKGHFKNLETGEITVVDPKNPVVQDFKYALGNSDWGFIVGYSHQIYKRLGASARFSLGMQDIFKSHQSPMTTDFIHLRGTFLLTYALWK